MNKPVSITGDYMVSEINTRLLVLTATAEDHGLELSPMLAVLKHVLTLADILQRYTHAANAGKRNATDLCFQIEKVVSQRINSGTPEDAPLFLTDGAINNIRWLVDYITEKTVGISALNVTDSVLRVTNVLAKYGIEFETTQESSNE